MRLVLAAVQLAALLGFARVSGLPLDDAWIHQVVARTFAESGTLGYAPGAPGAAVTSSLWAALLAINFELVHVDPVRWAFGLNVIATLVSGQLFFSIVSRARPNAIGERAWTIASFGAALAASIGPNVLWFAHSGMEASLLIALSLAAIEAATRDTKARVSAATAGVACGLLAWLRPDAMALGPLLVAHAVLRRRDDWRRTAWIAGPFVVAVVAQLGLSYGSTGHVLPATLAGRRWLWLGESRGLSGTDLAVQFAGAWADRLRTYTASAPRAAFFALAGIALHGAIRLCRARNDGARLLGAWAIAHFVLYAVVLPTPGHGGRYQPLIPFLFAACLVMGTFFALKSVVDGFRTADARVVEALAGVAIVAQLAAMIPAARRLRDAHQLAVVHTTATELGTGRFIAGLPKGTKVASFDIGGIGFAARRPIVDLGGLSDPAVATMLERGTIAEHLRRERVEVVVVPEAGGMRAEDFLDRLRLRDNPAVHLEQIFALETPIATWAPGATATDNSSPRQVVYRIGYTDLAVPIAVRAPNLPPPRGSLQWRFLLLFGVLAVAEIIARRGTRGRTSTHGSRSSTFRSSSSGASATCGSPSRSRTASATRFRERSS